MDTIFYIISIISIIVGTLGLLVIVWIFLSIHRNEKGLPDFEYIPFYSKNHVVKTYVSMPFNNSKIAEENPVKKKVKKDRFTRQNNSIKKESFLTLINLDVLCHTNITSCSIQPLS